MNMQKRQLTVQDMVKVEEAVKNNLVSSVLKDISHPTCIHQMNILVEKIQNLKHALAQLMSENKRLLATGRANPNPEVRAPILKDPRILLSQLKSENMRLREQIRIKFEKAFEAEESQPSIKNSMDDIMPDKKQEQIKLLKISLAEGEDRLQRYRLKVNPRQMAQAQRQHLVLIQEAVQMCLNAGMQYSQVPVRGYPQLTVQNRKLVDELRKKHHLVQELKKTVRGYNATQAIYDMQNNQMQRSIQDVLFHERMNPQHIAREKLRMRSLQLLDQKLRLTQLIQSGQDIRFEANGYFVGRNKIGLINELSPVVTSQPLLRPLI